MSLAVSLRGGDLEYSGTGLRGLLAQPGNLFRPRFWSMLRDLAKFYRQATRDADLLKDETISLGDYLAAGGYGAAFRDDHLLPMASAIWSAPPSEILSFPVATFIRFQRNHGLLQLAQRPAWETVVGGSIVYVQRLIQPFADRIRLDTGVASVQRIADGVVVTDSRGGSEPLRPCRHGHPCRSGPGGTRRSDLGRDRAARRVPLQPQPCRTAFGPELHAAAPRGLVELELYRFARWIRRQRRRHLLDEPPARHSGRIRRCFSPSIRRARRAPGRCITARSTIIRSSTPPRYRRSAGCGRCKEGAMCGSAALISARVFTRTDCRQASPSPSNSAGCGGRGTCPTSPDASSSGATAVGTAMPELQR